ncbi:MAG: exodeoxyribonuclease V subunit gamma [Clostridia bacterium]|nr:exodeoxyribonuclease V subunit gamma [Clostridia bacterium]
MSLQIVYGRAHSGKTQYILDKAKELYDMSKPLVIVVPEQFTHLAEKRVLTKLGSIREGVCEVLSFDRIAKRINSSYHSDKKHLSAVGQTLIISEILSDIELKYYKAASKTPGFAEVCLSEISEFKKYLLSPDIIDDASNKSDSVELSMKLKDLSAIYSAYEKALSGKYNDSDDLLTILSENLEKHKPYSGVTFFFDEFSSFNPQERRIISALSSQAEKIYLTLCCDIDREYRMLFKPTIETGKLVKEECEKAGCKCEDSVHLVNSFYANHELCHLERYLYINPVKTLNSECNFISINSFENPYSEVESVAQKIVKLVRQNSVRYRDIGIVCSDIESYSFIIRSVFDLYDIPYFIDEKAPVLDHSIVSFVVNILNVYTGNYNAEAIVNYLKSGCVDASREDIYIAENYILATQASKNTWLDDERWNKSVALFCDGDAEKIKALNSIRNNHILTLAKLHDCIKGRHSVKYITNELYNYLIHIGFDKKISDYIHLFKSDGDFNLAKQYERVWKTLIDAFDTLVYIIGEKTVNLNQYKTYLTTALGQQKTGIIPTSLDEVIVGDVKRSKSEYVEYQFVLGVNDSLFPAGTQTGGAITDEDKLSLSALGIELSRSSDEKAYFDRFLEYTVLTHPQKELIISYSYSNADFSSLRPAFVINMVKKIFPQISVNASSVDADDYSSLTRARACEILASSAAAVSRGDNSSDTWKDIYQYFSENDSDDVIGKINFFVNNTSHVTKLSSELTQKLYSNGFYSTISRIQKYNTCRYAYYLEYMLGLKEKDVFGVKSVDIGSLIHEIIEKVFVELKNSGSSLKNADNAFFEEKADEYLNQYVKKLTDISGELSKGEVFSVMRLKKSIVKSLVAIKEHILCSKFEPLGHEIIFGEDNLGCIEIPLSNGKSVKITGKIDRADSYTNDDGTYIRVIDYKTGNKTFSFTDAFYGLDVQLIVYLNALVTLNENSHPAGALYFKIQDPLNKYDSHPDDEKLSADMVSLSKMDGIISDNPKVIDAFSPNSFSTRNKLSSTQFSALTGYINSVLEKSANAIFEGEIDINPYCKSGDNNSCNFCPYGSICNFEDGKNGDFRKLQSFSSSKSVFEKILR